MGGSSLKKALGLWDLILLNIVAILGLRWVAFAGGVGPSSILLWILAMLVFFIPSALVVRDLSDKYPKEGGIYIWTKEAFGSFQGYICGFFYWVNNLIYMPNLFIFLGGVFLYVGGSKFLHLENNSLYMVVFSLSLLWAAVIINIIGLKWGRWIQNIGGISSWMPTAVLLILGAIYYVKFGSATVFKGNLMPSFNNLDTISVFSTLCFAFAGMELQSCFAEEIKEPKRNIPRAILISGILIAAIYILCTAALLVVIPPKDINVISGVVQVISTMGNKVGIGWIGSLIALFVVIGGFGGGGAWLSGTARIPFAIGIDKYLPSWFAHLHPQWGTPINALLIQGGVSSIFILMSAIGSTVKESYNILVDATAILYFIPYAYMFLSYIKLKKGTKYLCLGILGFLSTLLAIALSFIPPKDTTNVLMYEGKVVGGVLFFFLLGWVIYKSSQKRLQRE